MRSALVLCCLAVMLMFAGCGDSASHSTTAANVNGVFADAPVIGLSYSCGTQTGVTATGGTFSCPTGSTVTFSVGKITLCSGPAQVFMTPVSCAQISNPAANTSTPSVIAVARFLQSISTTPQTSGALTITSAELQAAANLAQLDFATATDAQLQAAVSAIHSGAPLVDAVTAQANLLSTVNGALAGTYAGAFSGTSSGTWTITLDAAAKVSGSAKDSKGNTAPITGSLVNGTTFSGYASSATWTGTLDTSKTPVVFSGSWSDSPDSGTFTGTKQ